MPAGRSQATAAGVVWSWIAAAGAVVGSVLAVDGVCQCYERDLSVRDAGPWTWSMAPFGVWLVWAVSLAIIVVALLAAQRGHGRLCLALGILTVLAAVALIPALALRWTENARWNEYGIRQDTPLREKQAPANNAASVVGCLRHRDPAPRASRSLSEFDAVA